MSLLVDVSQHIRLSIVDLGIQDSFFNVAGFNTFGRVRGENDHIKPKYRDSKGYGYDLPTTVTLKRRNQ
jgi:hypothetical protein